MTNEFSHILFATRLTDQIDQTLPQLPHLRHRMIELPQTRHDDVTSSRILTGPSLLEDEPRQRQYDPNGRRERDEHAESPVIVRRASIDIHPKHDPDNDRQDDDLPDGLDIECHIGQLAPLHRIRVVVLISRDFTRNVLLRLNFHICRISRQSGKRRRPKSQRRLVRDQSDDVQSDSYLPFLGRVHTQPGEADSIGDDRQDDQNVRSPLAEIGEAAEDEEHEDLDGEGDAVAEEDDAVDGAVAAGEEEGVAVAGGLVEEILEGCWGEVWHSCMINNLPRNHHALCMY
jgi:hypothetical protein